MTQKVYTLRLKNIFKDIPYKGIYHLKKVVEFPHKQTEIVGLDINFDIAISSQKDDAIIKITLQTRTISNNHQNELLEKTLITKGTIVKRLMNYLKNHVTTIEVFKTFVKSLRTPKRIFNSNFYTYYDDETLNRIWDKVGLKGTLFLNPKFIKIDIIELENLFITNAYGFVLFASDSKGEYDIKFNASSNIHPTIYKSKEKIGILPWDEFLDILEI
jgi:hypothetical protein